MLRRRKAVSGERRAEGSKALCRKLLEDVRVRSAIDGRRPLAVYLASPDEIDLGPFIRVALAQGAALAVPRWTGETYDLAELDSLEALTPGPHGILEPVRGARVVPAAEVAVWIVPGLAFTPSGSRLGYGGGWYDRFLSEAAPDALKLGLAYDFQLLPDLPVERYDQRLDGVFRLNECGGIAIG